MKTKKKWLEELIDYLKENYVESDKWLKEHFELLDEIELNLAHKRKLKAERKFLKELDNEQPDIPKVTESKEIVEDNTEEFVEYPSTHLSIPKEHICEYVIPQEVRDYIYPLVLVDEQRYIIFGQEIPEIINQTKDLLK